MVDLILLSFAFLAGLQAFFAPCSVAMIPAYVGYYVSEETGGRTRGRQLLFGLKAGAFASLGLLSIYFVFGLLLAFLGKLIAPFIPWIELVTGGGLLFLGFAVLLGYEFSLRLPFTIRAQGSSGRRFYLFGVAYALGAVGCTLPIFLLVIFQALAQGGFFGGLLNFVAYTLAMVSLMLLFSLIAAVSKTALTRFLNRYMAAIQKSAGGLIVAAGVYMVYLALQVITI